MDRRTNNRQRPAGEAAGCRGPPRNDHHQHNNASRGNQEDEEHQRLCRIIKKSKDYIKHLEELLEARDTECQKHAERVSKLETDNFQLTFALQQDNNSLIQKLSKTTEELSGKDAELLQCQTSWQEKYTALESITEDLAEKQQSWETEVVQLVAVKAELEDLCLYVNKKRRCFLLFPRRSSDDRETQLQKLRNKKKQEEMEAAGCSAQTGQQ
ncbi:hypothetical protein ABVT39_015978 [Epinephelus coioides]